MCTKLVIENSRHKPSSDDPKSSEEDHIKSSPHQEIFSDLQDFVEATLNAASASYDKLPKNNGVTEKVDAVNSNLVSKVSDCLNSTNDCVDNIDDSAVEMDEDVTKEHDSDYSLDQCQIEGNSNAQNDELDESGLCVSCKTDKGISECIDEIKQDFGKSNVVKIKLEPETAKVEDFEGKSSFENDSKQISKSGIINITKTPMKESNKRVAKLKRIALKQTSCDKSKLIVGKACRVGTFYCSECKNTYRLLGAYKNHKRNGKCKFECEHCGKSFTSRYYANYKCHLKNHVKDRSHTCTVCNKSYSDLHTLNIHMRKHSGNRPYMCQHCGLQFYSSSHLLSHENSIHCEPPGKYQCEICDAKLSTLGNLRVHQNVVHAEERPFTCEICGKSFKTQKTLEQVHAKVHLNVFPFVCDYSGCGKKFKRSGSFTEHVRRHKNQRSHFCKNCGKGFYTKKDLLLHTRVHTGEKPYKCEVCEYKCALLGNLQKHLKTHVT